MANNPTVNPNAPPEYVPASLGAGVAGPVNIPPRWRSAYGISLSPDQRLGRAPHDHHRMFYAQSVTTGIEQGIGGSGQAAAAWVVQPSIPPPVFAGSPRDPRTQV